MAKVVKIGKAVVGDGQLAIIAGPCVIEKPEIMRTTIETLVDVTAELGLPFVFKSSFDKANRSSAKSYRGEGFERGLETLAQLKERYGVPVISDVHETGQVGPASRILDAIQIPAFLSRQTDLLVAAADSGLPVNVKKGQFMAPDDLGLVVEKMAARPGFRGLCLCERGTTFGYHNLVVDMRSLVIARSFGWPVVFDATHSVQLPSAGGTQSGGDRRFVPYLARAAVAVGVDAVFLEIHPDPEKALCDGPNQWPLSQAKALLRNLRDLHRAGRRLTEDFLNETQAPRA
ncbi:MAG: 3-deoxy-8-phosphooctulonate synthase [Deltaproteobacteria bacterium]|nr:3-deoxy-8-phosphooctulonate synthase [Deltaproteobacteria bacterium]